MKLENDFAGVLLLAKKSTEDYDFSNSGTKKENIVA